MVLAAVSSSVIVEILAALFRKFEVPNIVHATSLLPRSIRIFDFKFVPPELLFKTASDMTSKKLHIASAGACKPVAG